MGWADLELPILLVASTGSLLVGLGAYFKNPRSATHQLFGFLSLILVGWSAANYLSIRELPDAQLLIILRLIFTCVVLQNSLFFLFSFVFPSSNYRFPVSVIAYTILSLGLVALIQTPFVINGYQEAKIIPGPAIIFFIIHALISVVGGFRFLLRLRKRGNIVQRNQVSYLFTGSTILWFVVPLTNFVIPVLFANYAFVRFSALYVLLFNTVIAYAVLKHRLFDFRLVVARAIAYILTLGFTFLLYGALLYLLSNFLFRNLSLTFIQQVSFVFIALLSAPIIVLAKKSFDKLTARIFYQDSYSPETFFGELNKQLVRTIDLDRLVEESANLLNNLLKASRLEFFLTSGGRRLYFSFPARAKRIPAVDMAELVDGAREQTEDFIDVSEENLHTLTSFKKLIYKRDTPIYLKLKTQNQKIGFILVGPKKSGTLYSGNDLKILQATSDELALAIQNALRLKEIEGFNKTLQDEIEDATKRLRFTNAKLRALDETKDEFISMASHQLRTPLTSVKGYLSMVIDEDAGELNEEQKKLLNQAFVSSQRMNYLITDLLNVSRLRTGKFIIEPVEVKLTDMVAEEIDQLRELAHAKNITLEYERPEHFPVLHLDETKTRQVIMNFVDNALHYTPEGGKVRVELEAGKRSVELRVVDNGMGVPRSEQHKLFSKFYRAGNARRTRPDGTGLGLFMAKKVIIAQGGSIIFKSTEGKGSTFGFVFPLK